LVESRRLALFHLFLNISRHGDSVNVFYRRIKLIYLKGSGHDIDFKTFDNVNNVMNYAGVDYNSPYLEVHMEHICICLVIPKQPIGFYGAWGNPMPELRADFNPTP
jgi:hypothetical protein